VDAEIDASFDQVDQVIGDDQFDGYPGVAGKKRAQPRHDIEPAEHGRHIGPYQAGWRDDAASDTGFRSFEVA
jgi:hypothetical protein